MQILRHLLSILVCSLVFFALEYISVAWTLATLAPDPGVEFSAYDHFRAAVGRQLLTVLNTPFRWLPFRGMGYLITISLMWGIGFYLLGLFALKVIQTKRGTHFPVRRAGTVTRTRDRSRRWRE
jgi:hypothetical protein